MPMEDFEIQEDLGKGSFGCVVKVVRKSDGEVYAMKQIKLQRLKEKDKKNALNQVRFLASLKHPNLVSYREAFYDLKTQNLCIVMDFANDGDLAKKIKKHLHAKVRMKEDTIWRVACDLLEGLNKLHQSNIIHRDVKPANVFFHNGCAQIGDLNVAKHLKDPFTVTQTGTPYYASPEVWNEEPYDYKSDIWSLGCVLYQMAALKPPFRADTPDKLYTKIQRGVHDELPQCYSEQLSNFIKSLLTLNQKNRPSCKQLLLNKKIDQIKKQQKQLDNSQQQNNQQLLQTIKFPANLKQLNQTLPKPQYNIDSSNSIVKCKTAKIIKGCENTKQKSMKLASLKLITSQKIINLPNGKDGKEFKDFSIRKSKMLNKNGSQKIII